MGEFNYEKGPQTILRESGKTARKTDLIQADTNGVLIIGEQSGMRAKQTKMNSQKRIKLSFILVPHGLHQYQLSVD